MPSGATNTIANPNSVFTNAGIATVAGTYVFRISAKCADSVDIFDDVTITVLQAPGVPTISTPSNTLNCYDGTPITFSTNYTPAAGETLHWQVVGGHVGTFSNSSAPSTTLTPYFAPTECAPGLNYTVRLTVTNAAGCKSSAERTIIINRKYTVDAYANPAFVCGNSTTLYGSCKDNAASSLGPRFQAPIQRRCLPPPPDKPQGAD